MDSGSGAVKRTLTAREKRALKRRRRRRGRSQRREGESEDDYEDDGDDEGEASQDGNEGGEGSDGGAGGAGGDDSDKGDSETKGSEAPPADGETEGGKGTAGELLASEAGAERRSHRHYRFVWVMLRILRSRFGPDYNIVIGQDLLTVVRHRVKTYLLMSAEAVTEGSPVFHIMIYQVVPDVQLVPPVNLADYRGKSVEKKTESEDTASNLAVYYSTMSPKVLAVAKTCIRRSIETSDGDDTALCKQVKHLMTERFGSTWHVVHGLLSPGFCAAVSADDGSYLECRVSKTSKLFLYRNSSAQLRKPMSSGDKRLIIYIVGLVALGGWMYLQMKCNWTCLPDDDGNVAPDCTDASIDDSLRCQKAQRLVGGLGLLLLFMASMYRVMGSSTDRTSVSKSEVANAAKDL